jgi:hypothetical protein
MEVQLYSLLTLLLDGSAQLHAPATLPLGKNPQYPENWRLGGIQNLCGHFGKERNLLSMPGIKPQFNGCPTHSQVTRPIILSQLIRDLKHYKLLPDLKIHYTTMILYKDLQTAYTSQYNVHF